MDDITKGRKLPFSLVYFVLFILNTLAPPYTSKGYSWSEIGEVIGSLLSVSWKPYAWLAPFFHLIVIGLIIAIYFYGEKISRIFSFYVGLNYIFIAVINRDVILCFRPARSLTGSMFFIILEYHEQIFQSVVDLMHDNRDYRGL